MTRRTLVRGAAALLGHARFAPMFLWAPTGSSEARETPYPDSPPLLYPPKGLLGSTYTAAALAQHLLSRTNWRPYPRLDDRPAWQGVPTDVRDAVYARAREIAGTPWESLPAASFLEFKRNGNRSRYEEHYFLRQERITDLTLAECLEAKGRYLDEIANGIWLTCEESFWGLPAHLAVQKAGVGLPDISEPVIDLFAAETSATLAWVDYYLGSSLDQVSALIRPRIVLEAKRRILDPALQRNDFTWMGLDGVGRRLNNWNPWIHSNWMATNLLLEPDPARRTAALLKICKSLDLYLDGYSADGGCDEGPGYWSVSAASYFDCCATLASATGEQISVLEHPLLAKMLHYIADVHIAGDYYVNYGDAHAKASPSPELMYRLGSAVGDGTLQAFGAFEIPKSISELDPQRPLSRAVPNLLITGAARSAPKADALVQDAWYPDLCLMTARQKGGTSEGFYLAAQAAPNLRSHGHNDSGSFLVFHDGQPVLIDIGVEAYTAKTFSKERYSIWTMQSAYHNLPTVGGVMQAGDQAGYRASEIHYERSDQRTILTMNLATAYPKEAGIEHWTRTLSLERTSNQVRLHEQFQLRQKTAVVLCFMTNRKPTEVGPGKIVLSGAQASVRSVSFTYDAQWLKPSFESIVLQDEVLHDSWGATIYRILLSSIAPKESGDWAVVFS